MPTPEQSWLQRLAARIRNAVRPDDPQRSTQWFPLGASESGIVVTPENATELSAVTACVTLIASSIAAAPWHVVTGDGQRFFENDEDPLAQLLNLRPNDDETAMAFREALMISALLYGNGYCEVVRDRRGEPVRLWPLLPDRVTPRRDAEAPYRLFYEFRQQQGGVVRLEQDQVFHLRGSGITGIVGEPLVAKAARVLGLAAAQERFASTFFGNNTQIGGVLSYPGKLPRDEKGRPDGTIDRLRADWAAAHQGPSRAWRPAILEQGMRWQAFEVNASDAQLLEARRFSVEEIARLFGVPGHLVGIAASAQGYGRNLEGWASRSLGMPCVLGECGSAGGGFQAAGQRAPPRLRGAAPPDAARLLRDRARRRQDRGREERDPLQKRHRHRERMARGRGA